MAGFQAPLASWAASQGRLCLPGASLAPGGLPRRLLALLAASWAAPGRPGASWPLAGLQGASWRPRLAQVASEAELPGRGFVGALLGMVPRSRRTRVRLLARSVAVIDLPSRGTDGDLPSCASFISEIALP